LSLLVSQHPTRGEGCSTMCHRLQPYVTEAATLCDGGCNPVRRRLQPYVEEAGTLTMLARY
jgi:hypothetical protein